MHISSATKGTKMTNDRLKLIEHRPHSTQNDFYLVKMADKNRMDILRYKNLEKCELALLIY